MAVYCTTKRRRREPRGSMARATRHFPLYRGQATSIVDLRTAGAEMKSFSSAFILNTSPLSGSGRRG